MSEYVVKAEPCEYINPCAPGRPPELNQEQTSRCHGCLHNGERAVSLVDAVKVERVGFMWEDGTTSAHTGQHARPKVWVEVQS